MKTGIQNNNISLSYINLTKLYDKIEKCKNKKFSVIALIRAITHTRGFYLKRKIHQ